MRLTQEVAEEIRRAARESRPRECCGIVLAASPEPALGARILPSDNVERRDPGRRYRLDHRVHIRAVEEELKSGAVIVAYYHSHVDGPAEPSLRDARLACPGVTYLVAGPATCPQLRAWRWTGERFEEEDVRTEEQGYEPGDIRGRSQV